MRALLVGIGIWGWLAQAISISPVEPSPRRELYRNVVDGQASLRFYLETEFGSVTRRIIEYIIVFDPSPCVEAMRPIDCSSQISTGNSYAWSHIWGAGAEIGSFSILPAGEVEVCWHRARKTSIIRISESLPCGCLASVFKCGCQTKAMNCSGHLFEIGRRTGRIRTVGHINVMYANVGPQLSFGGFVGTLHQASSSEPEHPSNNREQPFPRFDAKERDLRSVLLTFGLLWMASAAYWRGWPMTGGIIAAVGILSLMLTDLWGLLEWALPIRN